MTRSVSGRPSCNAIVRAASATSLSVKLFASAMDVLRLWHALLLHLRDANAGIPGQHGGLHQFGSAALSVKF
jgi:hypothetical protein